MNIHKNLTLGLLLCVIVFSLGTFLSSGTADAYVESLLIYPSANSFYYTYEQLTALLPELAMQFPTIFQYFSIGTTLQGRDIWVVKLSDNVSYDEDEPEVLYMGGVHGDEKPGYQVVITTLIGLLENYSTPLVNGTITERIRAIVNNSELFFIPMVNPDGVVANTRKNCRPNSCLFGSSLFKGVDLNRNYPYKWSEFDVHPLRYMFGFFPKNLLRTTVKYPFLDSRSIVGDGTYRGTYPLSENETQAISSFIETHNITISVDYHIFGEKVVYPWFWTNDPPEHQDLFVSIAENISSMNGYSICQGSSWYYICGCAPDWMYAEHHIYSLVIEVCPSNRKVVLDDRELINKICTTHFFVNLYIAETANHLHK